MNRSEWLSRRSFDGASFDPERLAAARLETGTTVSVCLPALDVADTIGPILATIRDEWMTRVPLVDELVVVDSRSSDATVAIARGEGARVYQDDAVLPGEGPGHGKGEALWKSLHVSSGDLVLWVDSDIVDFDGAFVPGMLGPLLTDPEIGFVKAVYRRALGDGDEGGRVTEICARPLLNLCYPELAVLAQPLAGEQAGRRRLLERLPFLSGYAVEVGLLIDLLRDAGLGAIAQVDLGRRAHVNQSTAALGAMAYAITQAVLRRVAEEGRAPAALADGGPYGRPVRTPGGGWRLQETAVRPGQRPPIATLAAYRHRRDAAAHGDDPPAPAGGERVLYLDLDGSLLGPGGRLFAAADGRYADAGARAVRAAHDAGAAVVLVSGRSRVRLDTVARLLAADGILPELGALDAGYPVAAGQSVHEAIAATGIVEELLAREPGLEPHPAAAAGREGSHVLRGVTRPDAAEWVRRRSGGTLRLADNGRIGPGDTHVFHLLPTGASKALAVSRDLAARGADPAACLMVGDSAEDMEVARCGVPVALVRNGADADPALAARVPWVTAGSHGEGVLEAVTAWLAGRAAPVRR